MTKFIVDVELDGYDTMDEMFVACNADEINEALEDYGFTVISVRKIENEN